MKFLLPRPTSTAIAIAILMNFHLFAVLGAENDVVSCNKQLAVALVAAVAPLAATELEAAAGVSIISNPSSSCSGGSRRENISGGGGGGGGRSVSSRGSVGMGSGGIGGIGGISSIGGIGGIGGNAVM